ncbi:major facilitator superfamily domain-containing protein [Mycena pura]|uniref:Major facilitator superfamily domain-containing protein n=1 Tax=Mycena pura TaxID=153505 RepID=A0AAD6UUR4_9AGAR|nr:major facilitator superfamily domain-containing protein [Mycena pura]
MDEDTCTETTALLPKPKQQTPTPLPKLQLGIVMFVQISEPTASYSIYPYINQCAPIKYSVQLVSELDIIGGDKRKVGYYAGLLTDRKELLSTQGIDVNCAQESLFFVTQATTVLQWSRASDYIGRKPILVAGLFGTALSMLCFGMSRTFWALVPLSDWLVERERRCHEERIMRLDRPLKSGAGFCISAYEVVWNLGAALGFYIGGQLSQPQLRFPNLFSGQFWRDYPYFLPSLATGSSAFFAGMVGLLFFKELVVLSREQTAPSKKHCLLGDRQDSESNGASSRSELSSSRPQPLRKLLTFPILISVSNYIALAFLSVCMRALLPLVFAMPLAIGGLGLPPAKIGAILSVQSVAVVVFQLLFFARFIRRFGARRVMIGGMSMYLFIFALFPIISISVQASGRTPIVWALVVCLLMFSVIQSMSYGAVYMFLAASAPKNSRGTVNGLGQTSVSVARAIGPALSTSLFSLSVERNLLGGHAIYAVFFAMSVCAVILATHLPAEDTRDNLWNQPTEGCKVLNLPELIHARVATSIRIQSLVHNAAWAKRLYSVFTESRTATLMSAISFSTSRPQARRGPFPRSGDTLMPSTPGSSGSLPLATSRVPESASEALRTQSFKLERRETTFFEPLEVSSGYSSAIKGLPLYLSYGIQIWNFDPSAKPRLGSASFGIHYLGFGDCDF